MTQTEQQLGQTLWNIADCLTALDTRFTAQEAKIDTLKQYKRGLMQQLFPALAAVSDLNLLRRESYV